MQYVEKTLTGIIESGQSSITFTDDFIADNSIIDVFFSDDDINPTEQTQTGNRVIIDILPLDHNISIAVRVTNADVIDYNSEIESIEDTLTSHSSVLSSHGTEIINLRHDVTDIETEQTLIVQDISDLSTNKQDELTAGENITIENNIISATGGSSTVVYSTEEVRIGTFLNKPLYRQMIQTNSGITSGSQTITSVPQNVDYIISCVHLKIYEEGHTAINVLDIWKTNDGWKVVGFDTTSASGTMYLIFEYTKVGE